MKDVYINAIGKYLLGPPVDNGANEAYIGLIGGQSSRMGKMALRQNGIQQRYSALTPEGHTD